MDLHISLVRDQPLRAQLEQRLREAVRSGRLRPGVRLPASRLLAQELGVSRGVVVEAYAQLTAEGYLETHGSGGTRVAATFQPPLRRVPRAQRIRFDLRPGLPDSSLFPRRAWASATATIMRELPDAALLYGPTAGQRRLRRAITTYLGRTRAIVAAEEQTFITCGASHAFSLLWSGLRAAGVLRVAHEDPGWERIPATIVQAGLEAVPVRVDGRGLSVRELQSADVQAVVISPAHQYPSGVVMHPSRRERLLAWARESGGLIIEDDYDAEYRYGVKPPAPLRSADPANVAYVGTTSKTLAPALRLGWLIVPSRLVDAVSAEHAVSHAQPSVINQAAFASLLENGEFDRHLRRTRTVYGARRRALISAVERFAPGLRLSGGAAGLHLMGWLPTHADEAEVTAEALSAGVAVEGLRARCSVTAELGPALVLGYGAISEPAIGPAMQALAGSLCGQIRGAQPPYQLQASA